MNTAGPAQATEGDATEARANILIVDDQPGKLLTFETVLQELGQNLVFASSGRDALRHVLERDFAVILLDVNMPELDGFETAELIRGHRRSAHTPIIFITAYADEIQMVRGYTLGAVDYLLSPFVPAVLRSKVGVFVQLHAMQLQTRRQAEDRAAMRSAETAREAAERQQQRSAFLSRASRVLGGSLDATVGARELALLALQADEGLHGSACVASVAHDGSPQVEQLALGRLPAPLADALRAAFQRRVAVDEDGVAAYPLMAGDALLGALAVLAAGDGTLDTPLLDDLAERAGVAFQNARLYRSLQHEIVERRAAERQLQAAGRRKDEFLAMLSHELRNPLAAACSALELVRRLGPLEPRLQQAAGVMDRQLGHMTRLIEELLDVARISQDKIVLVREPVDLNQVIAHSVESVQRLLEQRSQTLRLELPDEPVWINGDAARLAQIVSNLLHNAAKYSPAGAPIELRCAVDGSGALIKVRDQGEGIDAELLPHVFDMFAQGQRGLDRGQGGLGVGLTLAMRLAQLHGGRVEAYSDGPGCGSEFRVRLPCLWLAHSEAGRAAAALQGAAQAPAVRRRVVVIDDNLDAAEGTAALLQLDGHEVRTAGDGIAGLTASAEFRAEVVIVDIGLPLLDGHEVARRLRSMPASAPLLLIALTGYGQPTDRAAALEAGFDCHFVKPVDPDDLMRCISQWSPPQGAAHAPAAA
jgi:signal transduction histidine kinase/DNA-binding response OmpR family regulator